MTRPLLLIFTLLTGCNFGSLPDKYLSKSNISFVELSFPNNKNKASSIKLDSTQIDTFAKILSARKEAFVKPNSYDTILIKLKDSGAVQYCTDGLRF